MPAVSAQSGSSFPATGSYSFGQLEQLWLAAGGSTRLAPTMAAIALAESGGNPQAHNGNASTGDDSYGLWQINYFGSLKTSRTARYGSPQQLLSDPLAQARAAVSLASGGSGLSNWTTYSSGAYQSYLGGAQTSGAGSLGSSPTYSRGARPSADPLASVLSGIGSAGEAVGSGFSSVVGDILGIGSAAGKAVAFLVWLFSPKHWLMLAEAVIGSLLMLLGLWWFGTGDDSLPDVPSPLRLKPLTGPAKSSRLSSTRSPAA